MLKRILLLFILSLLIVSSNHTKVTAAACRNIDSYGSVNLAVPTLPSRGTYTIWTRMQAPDDTHNRYHLEINGNSCYNVGGSSVAAGQWTWVAFQDGVLSNKTRFNFEHTTDNMLKLIGSDAGVKIDRLLILKNDCIPTDLGANCQSESTVVNAADTAGATEIPPPNGPVSGLLVVSPTVQRDPGVISKVVYFSDGIRLPVTHSFSLDTTLLENGSHRIAMQITRINSTVVNEATTLEVQNKETVLSPVTRWARLHTRAAITESIAIGLLLVVTISFLTVRHIHLKRRLLRFRGF